MEQNLTPKQVSEIYGLGMHHLALMRMRDAGPPFIKISGRLRQSGGRIVYPAAGVKAWLESLPRGGGQ